MKALDVITHEKLEEIKKKQVMRRNSVAQREVQAKIKQERLVVQDIDNKERYHKKNNNILNVQSGHNDKLKQLEQRENKLIERLKQTSTKTKKAYGKLDRVVQEGYAYYMNAGEEKRNL